MKYVNEHSKKKLYEFEERFTKLPLQAGVLFVSVTANPVEHGDVVTFDIRLGLSRKFQIETGLSLIQHVLREEIAKGIYEFRASVYLGRAGASRDEGDETARQYPA